MKTTRTFILLFVATVLMYSCNKNEPQGMDAEELAVLSVSTKAPNEGITTCLQNNICPVLTATAPLTANEIEFLFAMREDEKLSRDVTEKFEDLYPTSPFANIAAAEATHIAAVETLLAYYEISFPVLDQAGVFGDESRQNQYDNMIDGGSTLLEAYKAAALLEEENIDAYTKVLPNIANVNIKMHVENMIKASSNHLKAYVRQINALGGTYTPTILDKSGFDTIVNSAFGQGKKYAQQGQRGRHMGNGGQTNSQKAGQAQGCKGSLNSAGTCTSCVNGNTPGTNQGNGQAGRGYRGGM